MSCLLLSRCDSTEYSCLGGHVAQVPPPPNRTVYVATSLAMVKKFNSAPKDNTPPLRFEVWHFTDLGRNSEDNDALAQAFIRTKLQSWKVRKVRPVTSPENSNDRYTPIEVDFHYCHSSSSPDESFRVLWGRTIPSVIRAFFSTRSEPYNMTLYPLGDNLDLNVRKGFTRTTIQRSMAVEYATQSQLVSPDVDDTVLVELLRIGGTILRPGAAVADICIDAKRMLADMWHEGDSMTNLVDRAKEKLLESGILERLEAHYGTDGQELSPILTNEMTSAWQNAAVSFNFFGSLASDMKDILGDLSHKIKSSQPIGRFPRSQDIKRASN
ncbi:hypothetical protein BKA56DRAFT_246785 [Ilyonectria sp. MPI-CAGE-AT-0026]|nr:hypothetical protein BKA56DRAFT_246785 [Ilyonectria sp. MPI-CAGE-AT-0026]